MHIFWNGQDLTAFGFGVASVAAAVIMYGALILWMYWGTREK